MYSQTCQHMQLENVTQCHMHAPSQLNAAGIPFAWAMHGFTQAGGRYYPEIRGKVIHRGHWESLVAYRRWKDQKSRLQAIHADVKKKATEVGVSFVCSSCVLINHLDTRPYSRTDGVRSSLAVTRLR